MGVVLASLLVAGASASSGLAYSVSCSDVSVLDPAVCERVQAAASAAQVSADYAQILAVGVWFLFGGVLMLIAAPLMEAAFRWWRA